MKKQFLLIAFVAISFASVAQLTPSFGIRAGVSSSGMRGDAVNNLKDVLDFTNGMVTTTDRTGFFAGGYASIPVSDLFSIEPGISYAQKGYQLKGDLNLKGIEFIGANAKAHLNTQYIDLPVVLKADMDGLQLFAGPQLSYLADADLRMTAGVLGLNLLNTTVDATQQFNRWDAGVTAGVGYKFLNGLNVTASYDHGLTRVDANKSLNSYNRAFKIGLGMTF